MKIRFIETRVVDDHRKGTPEEERYEAGETYDLPEASAQRWLRRNAAEAVVEDKAKPARGRSKDSAAKAAEAGEAALAALDVDMPPPDVGSATASNGGDAGEGVDRKAQRRKAVS